MNIKKINTTILVQQGIDGDTHYKISKRNIQDAYELIAEAAEMFAGIPFLLKKLLYKIYSSFCRAREKEIAELATKLNVAKEDLLLLQYSYELSHVSLEKISKKVQKIGCTSGIRFDENLGMVHVRTLDWPLVKAKEASHIFKHVTPKRTFYTVGFLGMLGALSGMVPGEYSITLNWAAPTSTLPSFTSTSPSDLIKQVLEKCDTYEEAVAMLKETKISTNVFFTVCGKTKKQACTIERTKNTAAVRGCVEGQHVQTNHYKKLKSAQYNNHNLMNTDLLIDSKSRMACMRDSLRSTKTASMEDYKKVLNSPGIVVDDTVHGIIFNPRQGKLLLLT